MLFNLSSACARQHNLLHSSPPSKIPTHPPKTSISRYLSQFTNRNFPYLPLPSELQGEDSQDRLPLTPTHNRRKTASFIRSSQLSTLSNYRENLSIYNFLATTPHYSSFFTITQQSRKTLLLHSKSSFSAFSFKVTALARAALHFHLCDITSWTLLKVSQVRTTFSCNYYKH